ncbi:myosin phosphatase Rho-interacting protein-like isoform X2, partial [Clarias magur]
SKPVKAGWLLLAPEGIDFLNPAHKNRKWQRRYFILYEHGLLRYALDEMPGTLPQGSVNMSQCSDVLDASSQTSFCNSLRLCFSDRDYYIRAENTENFTGWQENLLVHPNAAKTNQKKRRREQTLPLHSVKRHAVPERNPSSHGTHVLNTSCSTGGRNDTKERSCETSSSTGYPHPRIGPDDISVGQNRSKDKSSSDLGSVEVGGALLSYSRVGLQEDREEHSRKGGVNSSSRKGHDLFSVSSTSSDLFSTLGQLPGRFSTNAKGRESLESGYSSLEKTRSDAEETQTGPDQDYRRSQVINQFEQENGMYTSTSELCSSLSMSTCSAPEYDQDEKANHSMMQAFACGHGASGVSASTCRRSKSLERSLAEHTSTPDLLNFKKGWMMRLEEDGKWKKRWFVLTNQSLRFYRDIVAEEAADLDGEINLCTCYDITDYPVQRNYGFQIHTKDGVFTLCAMTSSIRRNWIQAVMKNVHTSVAPDVTCSLPQKVPVGMVSESNCSFPPNTSCSEEEKRSTVCERRREGRYKTFDWAEYSHMQNKREMLSRQAGIESEFVCDDFVPPAPASTPEESASFISAVNIETGQTPHVTKPIDTSALMVRSSIVASKPNDQRSAELDGVDVFKDISNAQMKEKNNLGTTASPVTFSSLSVQTEWEWELELQSLRRELKAMYETSEREVKEYKLSEAHLKTELSDALDRLHETESKLQKTEATLKEREIALEELRSCLEDVSGRLKATEEAQALKDVRLERHLRLLEESQERERRSLGDSLEHAEKRGKELEERLMQSEVMLQKMPTGTMVEQLERKCQELQNQLDESDSELSRLQVRLQNEETLYYDMEHNYEQVCEELEFVRGTLQNCEKVYEERFRTQVEQQQEELNRKERELHEVFIKMGCSGVSVEMTENIWLRDEKHHLQESSNVGGKVKNSGFVSPKHQSVAQGDESEQVISVIQALENKLCDTEERLQEITVHLKQQQQKLADKVNVDDQGSVQISHTLDLQEVLQEEGGASPEKQISRAIISRLLSLESLVIQKMASALEHPSKLSEFQSHTKHFRETYERLESPVSRDYSQLFSYYREMGEADRILDELEIFSICMKAELAYLTYTNDFHNPEQEHGSQNFYVPFYLGSEDGQEEKSLKTGLQVSDGCKEQTQSENLGYYPEDMDKDHLVVALRTQARSLQALSKQLHASDEDAGALSEISPALLQTVVLQASLAYVASRLHVALQQQVRFLQNQREQAVCQCHRLEALVQEQAEHYEEKLRENLVVLEVAKLARISAETDAQIKGQEVQHLEAEYKKKLKELQQIHEEEMSRLHGYYSQVQSQTMAQAESSNGDGKLSVTAMKERIRELEMQIRQLEEEISRGDANTLRKAYEQELETLKVTCELGFSSMEQSHQRVIEEMQRQHQMEVEQLLEEKERVLQEETNATIAAIEAMRKAHKEELEKSQKAQRNGANTDINILHAQFKEELNSLHRELEALSEQYSQKCLENAHLSRTIETERQALSSVERENQELHTRNGELNKRLVAELALMQSSVNGGVEQAEFSQGKDVIQLEVALRVKESEIQCLKQEISSLKEELQAANRNCKKLLNEMSVSGVKCSSACAKRSTETFRQRSQSYDVMKSRSNPDFLKNRTKLNQQTRSK